MKFQLSEMASDCTMPYVAMLNHVNCSV
jgi:hypothetical protein